MCELYELPYGVNLISCGRVSEYSHPSWKALRKNRRKHQTFNSEAKKAPSGLEGFPPLRDRLPYGTGLL